MRYCRWVTVMTSQSLSKRIKSWRTNGLSCFLFCTGQRRFALAGAELNKLILSKMCKGNTTMPSSSMVSDCFRLKFNLNPRRFDKVPSEITSRWIEHVDDGQSLGNCSTVQCNLWWSVLAKNKVTIQVKIFSCYELAIRYSLVMISGKKPGSQHSELQRWHCRFGKCFVSTFDSKN